MQKTKTVKATQRKTKTGKTVAVKGYSAKYDSSEDMAKEAIKKRKGAGSELSSIRHPNKFHPDQDLEDDRLPSEHEGGFQQKDSGVWKLKAGQDIGYKNSKGEVESAKVLGFSTRTVGGKGKRLLHISTPSGHLHIDPYTKGEDLVTSPKTKETATKPTSTKSRTQVASSEDPIQASAKKKTAEHSKGVKVPGFEKSPKTATKPTGTRGRIKRAPKGNSYGAKDKSYLE
jgi:hypothetical protein